MAHPFLKARKGTVFFHDFQPGTYRFTVQAYGTPTNEDTTESADKGHDDADFSFPVENHDAADKQQCENTHRFQPADKKLQPELELEDAQPHPVDRFEQKL
jgi:hypothetical protein